MSDDARTSRAVPPAGPLTLQGPNDTHAPVDGDGTTRERVLALIVSDGPVSAASLATDLGLTPAGVRRHLAQLETDGLIAVHESGAGTGMRGRPARHYVATNRGQSELSGAYPDLATQALRYLRDVAGEDAVEEFAHRRLEELTDRYASRITADDVAGRAEQLATVLAEDGFAASVRPVAGTATVQLCQGHCPVQHVAEEFPQLCDAEAQVFSQLLGSHVQRLATLAGGGHACTTNVPVLPGVTRAPEASDAVGYQTTGRRATARGPRAPAHPPARHPEPTGSSTTAPPPPSVVDGTWKE
ncbi:helix-turn-helix transcriptional regulator [Oerskovia paurometabola]|uniref:helix-turn-helix transcriptional regulator n=1 Tax=Oerskovia paurometabola TaxID=162170 RepID=UPI00380C82B7